MTPPKFAVGDVVQIGDSKSIFLARTKVIGCKRVGEGSLTLETSTGRQLCKPAYWAYWVADDPDPVPWHEEALRPIPPESDCESWDELRRTLGTAREAEEA